MADMVELDAVPFVLGAQPEGRADLLLGTQPVIHSRPTNLISINDALEGHMFKGRVIHATFEDKGAVWIYTRGVGGSGSALRDGINTAVGVGPAFGRMHLNIQERFKFGY